MGIEIPHLRVKYFRLESRSKKSLDRFTHGTPGLLAAVGRVGIELSDSAGKVDESV